MNPEIISIIVFFSIVGILLFRSRKKWERYGIIFIRRWKRGLNLIDSLIRKHPKFVKVYGRMALVSGIIVMIGVFSLLVFLAVSGTKLLALNLVLPSTSSYNYPGPIISVPFWYWLISVFIIIFVHETSHGILARLAKVKLKNYGIVLLTVLPIGAFVEPNDKELKRVKMIQKLKVFAAGSFANFITGLIFLGFFLLSLSLFYMPYGVYFNNTLAGYPAHDANLTGVITNINGVPIKTNDDFSSFLNSTSHGTNITIATSVKNYTITTVARPDNLPGSFIGISGPATYYAFSSQWSAIFGQLFFWLALLNIGVGIANMLPIKPLDGGLILEELSARFFKKRAKLIVRIITIVTIGLIVLNILISNKLL